MNSAFARFQRISPFLSGCRSSRPDSFIIVIPLELLSRTGDPCECLVRRPPIPITFAISTSRKSFDLAGDAASHLVTEIGQFPEPGQDLVATKVQLAQPFGFLVHQPSLTAARCSIRVRSGLNSKIAYPSSQFWWLRMLAGLIHIAKRRGSKETAVFAAEL
jgi:hypothetical protein